MRDVLFPSEKSNPSEKNQEMREHCCLSQSNLTLFAYRATNQGNVNAKSLTKIYGNQRSKSPKTIDAKELIAAQV